VLATLLPSSCSARELTLQRAFLQGVANYLAFSYPYWAVVRECLDLHPSRLELYTAGKATVFCDAVNFGRKVNKFGGICSLHLHVSTKLLNVTSNVVIN
jgi:hypothetical protein